MYIQELSQNTNIRKIYPQTDNFYTSAACNARDIYNVCALYPCTLPLPFTTALTKQWKFFNFIILYIQISGC